MSIPNIPIVLEPREYPHPIATFEFITNPDNVAVFDEELCRIHGELKTLLTYPICSGYVLDPMALQRLFRIVNSREPVHIQGANLVSKYKHWNLVAREFVLGPVPSKNFHLQLKRAYYRNLAHFEAVYVHNVGSYSQNPPPP